MRIEQQKYDDGKHKQTSFPLAFFPQLKMYKDYSGEYFSHAEHL